MAGLSAWKLLVNDGEVTVEPRCRNSQAMESTRLTEKGHGQPIGSKPELTSSA